MLAAQATPPTPPLCGCSRSLSASVHRLALGEAALGFCEFVLEILSIQFAYFMMDDGHEQRAASVTAHLPTPH